MKTKIKYIVCDNKVYINAEDVMKIVDNHGDTNLVKQIKQTIEKETI
jgi:uncharacterized protein YlbG (UPF0298 family)